MFVYKLLRCLEWSDFEDRGRFEGSDDDRRDGYIHMSTSEQVTATRARYFAAVALVEVTLDTDALGDALRWEPSRGGALFPHLYRALTAADVVAVRAFPPLAPA